MKVMSEKEQEFTRLVREYKTTIYTVCYFYARDKEEAEDYFQEVLINLWRGLDGFSGKSSLRTWIWRVSLNTCSNMERKRRRSPRTVPLSMDMDLYSDADARSEQIRMLYDRISRLGIFDRAIILLWLDGMSYREMADIVGISLPAVTTRLYRIKEQLKSMSNQ